LFSTWAEELVMQILKSAVLAAGLLVAATAFAQTPLRLGIPTSVTQAVSSPDKGKIPVFGGVAITGGALAIVLLGHNSNPTTSTTTP
jgi:hypothetical protein